MSVSGHGRHSCPHFAYGVVAFHHVGGLQAVPPPHHIELVVNHSHAELQSPSIHDADLDPRVGPQVIFLNRSGTYTYTQD